MTKEGFLIYFFRWKQILKHAPHLKAIQNMIVGD